MNPNLRVDIAMSLMRALWGEVTPNVRAVLARISGDEAFSVEFYVDGDVDDQFTEAASFIETEVIADFPARFNISHSVVRLDAPSKISLEDGVLVFLRKELN